MVNKGLDFVRAEFVEPQTRDQQAFGEPGAEHRLLQPAQELSRGQEYCRHDPVIADLRALVDIGKELFNLFIGISVCVVEDDQWRRLRASVRSAANWQRFREAGAEAQHVMPIDVGLAWEADYHVAARRGFAQSGADHWAT